MTMSTGESRGEEGTHGVVWTLVCYTPDDPDTLSAHKEHCATRKLLEAGTKTTMAYIPV